jgi:hypothetical protein
LQPKIADGCPVRDYCPRDALASPPGTAEFRDECLKFLGILLDGNFFAKFLHFFPFEFRLSNFCWARFSTPLRARARGFRSYGRTAEGHLCTGTIAQTIVDSLQSDSTRAEAERQKRIAATQQRIAALRARMDQMYEDKQTARLTMNFGLAR